MTWVSEEDVSSILSLMALLFPWSTDKIALLDGYAASHSDDNSLSLFFLSVEVIMKKEGNNEKLRELKFHNKRKRRCHNEGSSQGIQRRVKDVMQVRQLKYNIFQEISSSRDYIIITKVKGMYWETLFKKEITM